MIQTDGMLVPVLGWIKIPIEHNTTNKTLKIKGRLSFGFMGLDFRYGTPFTKGLPPSANGAMCLPFAKVRMQVAAPDPPYRLDDVRKAAKLHNTRRILRVVGL